MAHWSTALEIITAAYRESNLIALGAAPSAAQTTEALDRLNPLLASVFGHEAGEPYVDWPVGLEGVNTTLADNLSWTSTVWQYLPSNVRMIAGSTTAQTVYLPPDPNDGARVCLIDPASRLAAAPITINGNGRTIQAATTLTISTNNVHKEWFYQADHGNWVLLADLASGDSLPFPTEFDDYFITSLAMRLNPRYGRAMAEASAVALDRTLNKLRARYRQRVNVGCDEGVLGLTSGYNTSGGAAVGRVNRGRMSWMV